MDPSTTPVDNVSGRSVIPRRLPPVPNIPSLRAVCSAPSPENSVFSLSPSSSGSSSPATSQGSSSPQRSPTRSVAAQRQALRPLPQIPDSCSSDSPSSPVAQLIVCRSCLNCITTSESLLPPFAVPPGSRAFRGFSGKASLFTEVYSVNSSPARVQLMVTGAHTMQEITCAKCSAFLGWKIVKAHEKTEKWKEGKWLMELENLWLARSEDVFDSYFEEAVERERHGQRRVERGSPQEPHARRAFKECPRDTTKIARTTMEKGLGLEFTESVTRYTQPGHQYYSQNSPNFTRRGGSAVHLPMTVAT